MAAIQEVNDANREARNKIPPAIRRAIKEHVLRDVTPLNDFQTRYGGETPRQAVCLAFNKLGKELENRYSAVIAGSRDGIEGISKEEVPPEIDARISKVDPYWQIRLDLIDKVGLNFTLADFLREYPMTFKGSVYGSHRQRAVISTVSEALDGAGYGDEAKWAVPEDDGDLDSLDSRNGDRNFKNFDELRIGQAVKVMGELNARFKSHTIGRYSSDVTWMSETGTVLNGPLYLYQAYLRGNSDQVPPGENIERTLDFAGFPASKDQVDVRYGSPLNSVHVRVSGIAEIQAPDERLVLTLSNDNDPGKDCPLSLRWISAAEWNDPNVFTKIEEEDPDMAKWEVFRIKNRSQRAVR